MTYRYREFQIPEYMMEGLQRYIQQRIEPGDFLCAVIENDLREACGRADDDNMRNLPAYVAYLYNEAPSQCWGSKEKMRAWLTAVPYPKHCVHPDKCAGRHDCPRDPVCIE